MGRREQHRPADPTPVRWTEDNLDRFWTWELDFPEHSFTSKYGRAITGALRPHIRRGHRVLDYGCGPGYLTTYLARDLKADVWAADSHPDAVALTGERNAPYARFHGAVVATDVSALAVQFDRVVAVEVVEHLEDAQLDAFFRRVKEILRPDGLLIVTTPNAEQLDRKYVLCPNCNQVFHRWQHVRSVDRAVLSELGQDRGFRLMLAVETDFSRPDRRFPGFGRVFRRTTLSPRHPHLFGVYTVAASEQTGRGAATERH